MCRINTNEHQWSHMSHEVPSKRTLVAPCVEVPGENHDRDVHEERDAGDEAVEVT